MSAISEFLEKKRYFRGFLVLVFLTAVFLIGPAKAQRENPPDYDFQRGMCYTIWDRTAFSHPDSRIALKQLKKMRVEYVQIVVTQYQEKFNSMRIQETQRTPNDRSVVEAISTVHELGMKVLLKPHIDLEDDEGEGYWRGDIGFYNEEDWKKWFKEYKKFILHYAEIARDNDVEILCVGTELLFATQKTEYWLDVIAAVREIYPGKLVYAANWDEYKFVEFWDKLDMAGIDAFFPLTYKPDPTMEDIKKGWEKWGHEIASWQSKINKPVIFTECGYASSAHAPSEPWASGRGKPDLDIQERCYIALFEAARDWPWLAGMYWWDWGPDLRDGGPKHNHFTPMGKPAIEVMERYYKAYRVEQLQSAVAAGRVDASILRESVADLAAVAPLDMGFEAVRGATVSQLLAVEPFGERIKAGVLSAPVGEEMLILRDGNRYEGEFRDGVPCGKGVFTWKNGTIYEGEFKNGVPHGQGKETRPDGTIYKGEFKNGYLNGKGIRIKKNGETYEGEFKNGMPVY